jgi:ribosomal protein S27E
MPSLYCPGCRHWTPYHEHEAASTLECVVCQDRLTIPRGEKAPSAEEPQQGPQTGRSTEDTLT